jgi:hypothetical protein
MHEVSPGAVETHHSGDEKDLRRADRDSPAAVALENETI